MPFFHLLLHFLNIFKFKIKGEEGDAVNMGVSFEVRVHIAESADDYRGSKKDTVNMSIRKVCRIKDGNYLKMKLFT